MFWRFHAAVFGVVAGLGLAAAGAVTLPSAIAAVAAGLEAAGYTDVRVTERIFGGFAIQGTKGADFAMIALDAEGKMLDHAELFRDADGDGVFETDETLGLAGRTVLRELIVAALEAKPGSAERELSYGAVDGAGFAQNMETLFATGGLRLDAGQTLGSGGVASTERFLSLDADVDGTQRRGEKREQLQTMAGFGRVDPCGDFRAHLSLCAHGPHGALSGTTRYGQADHPLPHFGMNVRPFPSKGMAIHAIFRAGYALDRCPHSCQQGMIHGLQCSNTAGRPF
jgi:hypothetical protein